MRCVSSLVLRQSQLSPRTKDTQRQVGRDLHAAAASSVVSGIKIHETQRLHVPSTSCRPRGLLPYMIDENTQSGTCRPQATKAPKHRKHENLSVTHDWRNVSLRRPVTSHCCCKRNAPASGQTRMTPSLSHTHHYNVTRRIQEKYGSRLLEQQPQLVVRLANTPPPFFALELVGALAISRHSYR